MKRLIYGMSFPRKKVLKKIEELSEVLNVHVIECIVYRNTLPNTTHHWCSEIAVWLNTANRLKCDTRLKEQDYVSTLFSDFGEDTNDAFVNLSIYRSKNLLSHQYPDFEVSDDLVDTLYSAYCQLKQISAPILASGQIHSTSEWLQIILPIFSH